MSATTRPTAPLPTAAVEAMRSLELALTPPAETAADYRAAEARANELMAIARTGRMSDLNADDLAHYVDLMAGARATLAKAGRLDLIGGGR
jgi:hypothetical protein